MEILLVCQKKPGLIRGRQRFSYFAGFAARELMREAKPVKLKKVAFSHFFDALRGFPFGNPLFMPVKVR